MIAYQDLIVAVRQLPIEKQLALMEELAQSLAEELRPPRTGESSLARVRGMLQPVGSVPSERQLRDAYTDYLIEKYE